MRLPLPPPPPHRIRQVFHPLRWLPLLDARVPLRIKKQLVEPRLNALFAEAIQEGDFDLLEGRVLSLDIRDLGLCLNLTLSQERLSLTEQSGEAIIRGDWRAFLCLAQRQEDPDGLFFRRQLVIEGDTELGLGVKNLLDSLDWTLDQGVVGQLLAWLERWAEDQPHRPAPPTPLSPT